MDFIEHLKKSAFGGSLPEGSVADLSGWMDPKFKDVFIEMVHRARAAAPNRPLIIIEVGTWKGLSAHTMASICKAEGIPVRIICIDTWLGAPEFWTWGLNDPMRGKSLKCKAGYPQVYYTFIANMIAEGHQDVIAPFPISSAEAVAVLEHYKIRADLIYIDAAHEYEAVKADIARYAVLGDRLFGDDYSDGWPGVKRAVDEAAAQKTINGVVWTLDFKSPI